MDLNSIIIILIVGAIAGWLAGLIMKGRGFGLIGNIILGIVGAFVGGWLRTKFDLPLGYGWTGSILTALLGAVVVLFVVGLFKK